MGALRNSRLACVIGACAAAWWALPVSALAITDGANATDVLGQYTDVATPAPAYTKFAANDGPNDLGFSAPEGMLYDEVNHRLFIADAGNHRVLVFDLESDNTLANYYPDNVLGQADFYSAVAANTQAGMNTPQGMALDSAGNRLFVAQSGNNRVTVYDIAAVTDGENATGVLGQATFTTFAAATTQAGLNVPQRIAYDATGNRLFVTQLSANRVTVFDVATVTNGESATGVLGQANFTTATAATTQAGMNAPVGVAYDSANNRLFVSQTTANRVTTYDVAAVTNGENAVNVIGQANFTTATAASTQAGLNAPQGLAYDASGNRLFVSQSTGNRVTVFDVAAITDGENAVNVLGQTLFTVITAANTQAGLNAPQGVTYVASSGRLNVTQSGNNRISSFDVSTIVNGENAVNLFGQYDDNRADPMPMYTKFTAHNGPNPLGLSGPVGLALDDVHNRLFVADSVNNRVLVYDLTANHLPVDGIPDYVLGQFNFFSNTAATTQRGLNVPQNITYDETENRLYVAQSTGNRVSVFDVADIQNGEYAVGMLGQASYTALAPANTQAGMKTPVGISYDSANGRLFVGQQGNNRVTVYSKSAVNGSNAFDALGQYEDSVSAPVPAYTKATAHNGPNALGLNAPEGAAVDATNHRLYLADATNHRVLVYNLDASDNLVDMFPDYVLGQYDFFSNGGATTQAGMNVPQAIAVDVAGNRLFVAQSVSNRVTVYDVSVITNGEDAKNVLGQATFIAVTAGNTQAGMNAPQRLAYDSAGNRLFVSQLTNNRVTVYDVADIVDGENATNVLGQASFTTFAAATTQAGLNAPVGLAYDASGNRLFVTQTTANRVSVFDVAAITDGENAVNVLGQANFTTGTAASTQAGMNVPQDLAYDASGNRLFVAQSGANRVTVYDVAAITDGENATGVLGQANFTAATAATTQAGMSAPQGLAYASVSGDLFVTQSGNHRVSVFDVAAVTNGENAVQAVGQYDDNLSTPSPVYTKSAANDGPNRLGLSGPVGLALDEVNHRLFVSDSSNNRVLVFNLASDNTLADRVPDNVLGQANFYANTAATTQAGMNVPQYLAYDSSGNRLFVAQSTGNRVTVYDVAAITNGENATGVLGQANFTTATAATTQAGMNVPMGVVYDSANSRLFVSQSTGNRVTVYDVAAITNGENATGVLGQANFTTATAATTQAGMNVPQSLAYDASGTRLFVVQSTANRVTVYDVAAITNGENAVNVLGQATFIAATAATTQAGMNVPHGVAYDPATSLLYVSQSTANRVTAYNVAAITDGESAVYVLGQPDFVTATAATSQAGMNAPRGLAFDEGNDVLYVAQATANRVTAYNFSTFGDGQGATNVLGQANFTGFAAATTQAGMNVPTDVTYDSAGNRLFVAQSTANRVTVYDVAAITDGENATNVLGQANFTTATAANTQAGMNAPQGLSYDAATTTLFVSQGTSNRVTTYDVAAITDGENAVNVLGQANFTAFAAANTQAGMNAPRGVAYDATLQTVYVAQATSNRIGVYTFGSPPSPPATGSGSDVFFFFFGE